MSSKNSHPRERYYNFGNDRPSMLQLEALLQAHEQLKLTPWDLLSMADIYIDLAKLDTERAGGYLDTSLSLLEETIEQVETYERAGWHNSLMGNAGALALAEFRRAELPAWLAATRGEAPTHDYDTLLTAAANVVSLATSSDGAAGKLSEFIPELLGARALYFGRPGWLARQALQREDRSPKVATNWDLGITDGTAASFDNPLLRFNTKAGKSHGRRGSQMPHLYARTHGYAEPGPVVWGCVQELDGVLPTGLQTVRLADATELDAITASLRRYFIQTAEKEGLAFHTNHGVAEDFFA